MRKEASGCTYGTPALEWGDDGGPYRHIRFLGEGEPVLQPPPRGALPRRMPCKSLHTSLEPATKAFYDTLCAAWGLRAARYRQSILARRQAASLRALRSASTVQARGMVLRDRLAAERALGAVMIGVTSFFRDPEVFERLEPLIAGRMGPLSVLSVGCSDGSELYSVAMLLAQRGALRSARLRGIDCRPDAIRAAEAGSYSAEAVAHVPLALRERYLVAERRAAGGKGQDHRGQERYHVTDELRRRCSWAVADAFGPGIADEPADVILCRNLAIYLTPQAAAELWSRLAARLRPGGLLVVGRAERPPAHGEAWRLIKLAPCIFTRGDRIP